MPEITASEAVRAKLRDFEQRIAGAITATRAVAGVKSAADQTLQRIEAAADTAERTVQRVEGFRSSLNALLNEGEALKSKLESSLAASEEGRKKFWSECEAAIGLIQQSLDEAEKRLKESVEASLSKQAETLTRLETSTKTNAQNAEKSTASALERASRIEDLVNTTKTDLENQIHAKLREMEESIGQEFKAINQDLAQQVAHAQAQLLKNLAEHEQAVGRQITDFLNKQTALVNNLTQHTDVLERGLGDLRNELGKTNLKLDQLVSTVTGNEERAKSELEAFQAKLNSHEKETAELKQRATEAESTAAKLGADLSALSAEVERVTSQLKARSWITGVK